MKIKCYALPSKLKYKLTTLAEEKVISQTLTDPILIEQLSFFGGEGGSELEH